MNLNQNYIYAMFSRSYDQSTKHSGVHLIGSAYSQASELDLNNLKLFLNNEDNKSLLTNSDQFIIVRITFDLALSLESNLNSTITDNKPLIKTIEHSNTLIEFILPISCWLINLSSVKSENYTGLLEGIIGSLKNKNERFDSHLNNTLFIFENISWSNIVEFHKLYNINISGVTKNTRPFLSTPQYNLSLILRILRVKNKYIYSSIQRLRLLDNQASLYVDSPNDIDNYNLFKLNKDLQFNLKGFILDLNIEHKINEIFLQIEDCKKQINSIKNSISSYKLRLDESEKKNNSNSSVKNKIRLNSIIDDRNSNLNLQIKKLSSLEEQHSNFTELKQFLPNVPAKLIGELYTKHIVNNNEKIIDPNLSLIKSNKHIKNFIKRIKSGHNFIK